MDVFSSIVSFFQSGGVFMYPIVVVFALGLAISIERYVYLSKTSLSNRMVWKKITPFIKAGKFHPFTGPVIDQDGKVQIAAGATPEDGHLLGMSYFVKGVQGTIPK